MVLESLEVMHVPLQLASSLVCLLLFFRQETLRLKIFESIALVVSSSRGAMLTPITLAQPTKLMLARITPNK